MIRVSFILLASLAMTLGLRADPVKKTPVDNSEKLCKECAEAFIKAMLDGKADDAIKLCATPFREPGGKMNETLDFLKKELDRGAPAGLEIKAGAVMTIAKYNEPAKAGEAKELSDEVVKEYGELLGKDGKIVLMEVKMNGESPPAGSRPHLLVRIKDGKAHIIGVGGR